jgi:hypothetical protein
MKDSYPGNVDLENKTRWLILAVALQMDIIRGEMITAQVTQEDQTFT